MPNTIGRSTEFISLRAFRLVSVVLVALSGLSVGPAIGQDSPSAQAGPATLTLAAPGPVAVGELIALELRLSGATDIAGYEAALLFDTGIAEYAGVEQRDNDLKRFGRDVSPLTAVELAGGAAVGFFTCPVADCVSRAGLRQLAGASGDLRLATVYLVANEPGDLEVRLDAVKFVDAAGQPVPVDIPQPAVMVQVGQAGAGAGHPAPASMWSLAAAAGAGASPAAGPFDVSGDGRVDHADTMEVALEWTLLRQRQQACGSLPDPTRDVNHDGCLDVADLQIMAAQYGAAGGGAPEKLYLPQVHNSGSGPAPTATATQPGPTPTPTGTAPPLTFVVNSTSDQSDNNIGNGVCLTGAGVCTLRAAIQEANARTGADTINFNIPGTGVHTIALSSRLPTLTGNGTTINGYSQPGASPNTAALADNAVIKIQIQGGGATNFDGLVITSANNTIQGLALYQLQRAIWIYGTGAGNNTIAGCFVGTNATGTYLTPSLALLAHGIHIEQGAHDNRVGLPAVADRNVVSGNGRHGIGIWHEGTDDNVVMNNIVGLNPAGTNRLQNRKHGLDVNFGAAFNIIGGTGANEHNVSSGNDDSGQELSHTPGTTGNQVIGNYIGTDLTGNAAPLWSHNRGRGLMIEDGATGNLVANNIIGGNDKGGIEVYDSHTFGNVIRDNRIGVSRSGGSVPNAFGVYIKGQDVTIGPGNIIANNNNIGVKVEGDDADRNTITRNSIYNNGGLGIDLWPRNVNQNDQYSHAGPNQRLNFPVLNSARPNLVTGTACAGCVVEIFIADVAAAGYGEGKTFIGSGTANGSGAFSIAVSGVNVGQYVTSTATDGAGNTSEFSLNRVVTNS